MLEESIMYYEEFATSAKEHNEQEMFVRGCNAAGYVHNLIVRIHSRRFYLLLYLSNKGPLMPLTGYISSSICL